MNFRPIPRVKFCGFTRAADVDAAVSLGADALGFNLARGPRKIALSRARELAAKVPPLVERVALFVDAPRGRVVADALAMRASAVQLHGDETPEDVAWIARRMPVIKALRVRSAADLDAANVYAAAGAGALLLDAFVSGKAGGSGATWDHSLLAGRQFTVPVILAGGLHAGNVAAAVAATGAWGVDTASGIESAPGRKCRQRMAAFLAACGKEAM